MAEREFWFHRTNADRLPFYVHPNNAKGTVVFALYIIGLVAFFFGGAGLMILGDPQAGYLLFGLGALFLLGGMRLIWAKTDPRAPGASDGEQQD